MHLPSILFLALVTSTLVHGQPRVAFDDVTESVGIPKQTLFKWGGPCIADLDGDGIYDIILSFHASAPVEIYWGKPDGTFEKDPFFFRSDVHGINVGFRTALSQDRLLAINVGGGRGTNLRPPQMYLVTPNRTFTDVTNEFGLGVGVGRGRITLFMDLTLRKFQKWRTHGGPDLTVVGFVDNDDGILQHGYENFRGQYSLRSLPGFEMERKGRAAVVDLDNDRNMEIISFPGAQIYKLTAPFTFEDVSATYIPGGDNRFSPYLARTTSAVAEFDMNNNGVFDLYFSRARRQDISNQNRTFPFFDILFKNDGSRLVDISESAGIPNDTSSAGVTSGDFDNDGYVDLFVSVFQGPDFFLMNNGNETFTRVNGIIPKDVGVPGHHAVAVDYDQDGRVDLIVAQGDTGRIGGPFLVMKNILEPSENRHYLLVRVGHHPGRFTTSLHAVVFIRVGRMRMVRRVGSPGTQAGGPSLLDTVHFGLGRFDVVNVVVVRWIAGGVRVMRNVAADQKIVFGIVD